MLSNEKRMTSEVWDMCPDESRPRRSPTAAFWVALTLILLLGAYLRFRGLGVRSLWQDEFSTWHAARLPFFESLSWQPELNIPPLYQLCLRMISDVAVAGEATLRAPAAVFGVGEIAAMAWLGLKTGGRRVALAAALIAACHALQIRYSQEVRPYTLWLMAGTVSMACWHGLVIRCHVRRGRAPLWIAYVLATALAFHAHYLTGLILVAQGLWLVLVFRNRRDRAGGRFCLLALVVVVLLCMPMTLHFIYAKTQVLQGLGWVPRITPRAILREFSRSSFGGFWLALVLLPASALWIAARVGAAGRFFDRIGQRMATGAGDPVGFLLVWLVVFWGGLLTISLAGAPLLVSRYLLPSAVPATLIPLLIAGRLGRRWPMILAVVFCIQTAPQWVMQSAQYEPGFRELVSFLNEHVDAKQERVVLAVDHKSYPNQEALERVAFDYYPTRGIPIDYVSLDKDGLPVDPKAFSDPRATYLILFGSEPGRILSAIDRKAEPILLDGESYPQLRFDPRRVVRISARPSRAG